MARAGLSGKAKIGGEAPCPHGSGLWQLDQSDEGRTAASWRRMNRVNQIHQTELLVDLHGPFSQNAKPSWKAYSLTGHLNVVKFAPQPVLNQLTFKVELVAAPDGIRNIPEVGHVRDLGHAFLHQLSTGILH